MSDRNSDGSNTYGGSNPPAAPFLPAHTSIGWKNEYKSLCKTLAHSGQNQLYYYTVPSILQKRLNLPRNTRVSFVDIPEPVDSIWHRDTRGKWVINIYTVSGNGRTDFRTGSFIAKDNESWCINVSEEHKVCTPNPRQFIQIELEQHWQWPDIKSLWNKWLTQRHSKDLIVDRAWLHLNHSTELVSQLTKTVDWHKAPGIWGLFIVPIKGATIIEYEDYTVNITKPTVVQTNILHKWIPASKNNVFWAYKIK